MSGVGHQSKSRFAPKTLSQMQLVQNSLAPGTTYRPYRNPRLIPYLRDNDLSENFPYGNKNDVIELSIAGEKNLPVSDF